MKTVHYLVLFAVSIVLSCNCGGPQPASNGFVVIPFDKGVGNVREMPLSHIASSVEYIPLETNEKSLISGIRDNGVVASPDYFFIHSAQGLMQFTRSGKYVRMIGGIGQGPGEYMYFHDVALDINHKKIYLLTHLKVYMYDFDGNFIREMATADSHIIGLLHDTIPALGILNQSGESAGCIGLYNSHGDSITTLPEYDETVKARGNVFTSMVGFTSGLNAFNKELCYKATGRDIGIYRKYSGRQASRRPQANKG